MYFFGQFGVISSPELHPRRTTLPVFMEIHTRAMKQLPFPVATIEAKVLLKGQEKSSGLCISRY